jgi:hypothetical protein
VQYPEVEQPVAREVEALWGWGSGEWPGRESDSWTGCLLYDDGSRAGSAAGAPEKGSKVGDKSLKESESVLLGSTSENLIAFDSVSTPLGREAGVVGDGGEKMREEAVDEGLDASVTPGTPGILMVDETRRSIGSLANWHFLEDEVPMHNYQSHVLLE